jgi:glutamate dehydrogenase (NADP+)
MNKYAKKVLTNLQKKYFWEKEFLQAVEEVFNSISPLLDRAPKYEKEKILERIVEPERIIIFRVPWMDDRGEIQVNTGYRVEFNSAIGPYKGGIRFHPSVNLSILKFLGFDQIFKNSLTGLMMGGGKGGSDFDYKGKTDNEMMRFCQSFMTELSRHIGAHTDVPAGDIGVGAREIGFLFGQYKRLKNIFEGVLTGKGTNWGGSYLRPEATGFGVVYFTNEVLNKNNDSFEDKKVLISGSGNVALHAALKVIELGGTVLSLSDSNGSIIDKDGIDREKWEYIYELKVYRRGRIKEYSEKFGAKYFENKRPWGLIKADIALPCATENELNLEEARALVENGCFCVIEGANMPTTLEAIEFFNEKNIIFAPGIAANAGGVGVSGLEMAQDSMMLQWTKEEVDEKLKRMMKHIHKQCIEVAEEVGTPGNYVNGASIAGFKKVADTMIDQGLV